MMTSLTNIAMLLAASLLLSARPARAQDDPFAPFNNDTPPRVVTTVSTSVDNGVQTTRLRFASRPMPTDKGLEPVEIYAILCRPAATAPGAKLPGLLVLHGGAGWAEENRATGWARRGYVALAPDLPSIGNPTALKSVGPFMRETYGADHFRLTHADPTTCGIFEGVVAGLQALALLRSQPDVDPSRVGIVGISWAAT
jgi:cephalosporin-C deacetylase-like acetyl esterase